MSIGFFLKSLQIQNFATFKNQKINFTEGFNAIVGETGSGKSLLLDALELILGARADKKFVRKDSEYSLIEATFFSDDPSIYEYLESLGYPIDGKELVIKRVIYRNGSSKSFLNHLSCSISFLNQFAKKYIDLVGQFENQKLLSEGYQLHLLDNFSKNIPHMESYRSIREKFREIKKEIDEIEKTKLSRDQRLDYISYQLQEIEKLNPSSQDEADLLKKKEFIINFEKNQKMGSQIIDLFDGNESITGLIPGLRSLQSIINKNTPFFQDCLDSLSSTVDHVNTLYENLAAKFQCDIEQENLDLVMERIDLYSKAKKKFGGSVESILQAQVDFMKEKSQLEELELSSSSLNREVSILKNQLLEIAEKLHHNRIIGAKQLSKDLTSKVRELRMNGATIKIEVNKSDELNEFGFSHCHFTAETNPGEGYHKVKDVASGGELSRILLSVRQLLSGHDSISIFLFDEIDTGIGGETAIKIGEALRNVSKGGQVIAITHLPQIAQFSQSLVLVNKDIITKENRTESFVKILTGEKIKNEVKAMAHLSQ